MTKQNINKIPKILTKVSKIQEGYGYNETVFERPLLICSLSESEYELLRSSLRGLDQYIKTSTSIEEDYEMIFFFFYNDPFSEINEKNLLSFLDQSGQLKEFLIDHGSIQCSISCDGVGHYTESLDVDICESGIEDSVDPNNRIELFDHLYNYDHWDIEQVESEIDERSLYFRTRIMIPQGTHILFLEDHQTNSSTHSQIKEGV